MNKFFIKTFGCKVNQYDSAYLAKLLIKANWQFSASSFNYYIINTCAVTQVAIRKQLNFIEKTIRENPQVKVIVIGCLAKTQEINNKDVYKDDINRIAYKLSGLKIKKGVDLVLSSKSRYFLKVADGCDQYCSYCIIPYAKGKIKSRPINDLIQELKLAEDRGFKEIVLTGIHLGKYGVDLKNVNLLKLLQKLLKVSHNIRFRLSSIEINELDDDIIKLIKDNKRICRHLHISLQSGSSKILKKMNRPYNKQYFKKRINYLKKELPDIALTTDVIVAFPGETEADFQETYNLVKEINFLKVHVFPFSSHSLTKASRLKGQLSEEIKKKSSLALRTWSQKQNSINTQKIIKSLDSFDLIIESKSKDIYIARSQYYFSLKFKLKKNALSLRPGDLVSLKKSDIEII